jgi:hypothetical protein
MPHPNQITQAQWMRLLGTPDAPRLLDVRLPEDIARDPRALPTSVLTPHDQIPPLPAGRTVIVCARGRKLSEGGTVAWAEAGLPLAALPQTNLWVTRHRPKIDRIACPWLIRRFINAATRFLHVAPAEVPAVAERFNATPFDIEGVAYSHRGDTCTFDTMLSDWGLQTAALLRLAVGMILHDTMYRWARNGFDASHDWPTGRRAGRWA